MMAKSLTGGVLSDIARYIFVILSVLLAAVIGFYIASWLFLYVFGVELIMPHYVMGKVKP
jgi:type IV secretory pathway TrbD component